MLHTSEQFASENVVHGGQTRTARSPSSFDEHQSEEEQKRADPQRVRRADPQTSQNERDDEHSTETARCCSGDHSPDEQFDGETVKNKISHPTVQDVRGQNKTHLRDVTTTKEQTIRSTFSTATIKTSLRMRKKTVEVPQMHDIDEIVSSLCVETEEGLKRPKRMNPWQRRLRKRIWFSTSTESYQWTRSLVMLNTLDHVAQSATVMRNRSLILLLIVLRRLLFKHRQLKTLRTRVSTSVEKPHQVPR